MDAFSEPEDIKPDQGQVREFVVEASQAGVRLDLFLSARMKQSRAQVQDWIEAGRVLVDGKGARCSARTREGWRVLVEVPPLRPADPEAEPDIPLNVLYEDAHVLVLDKQRGLTVHPGSGAASGTLVNALLARCRDLSGIRGVERPGIVHRLDKNTSGLMVVAKHDQAHYRLQQQFQDRTVVKLYEALVHGVPSPSLGRIDAPIGRHKVDRKRMSVQPEGRAARTDYEVVEVFACGYAHLELHLHTGRTHQIRVHLAHLGFPIVGDTVYGKRPNPFGLVGQALHCKRLEFTHPVTGALMDFSAPPPAEFQAVLDRLRAGG